MNPPSKASFFDGLYHVHDDATESTDDEEADPGVVSFSPRRPSAAKEAVPNPPTTRPVLKRPPESLRFSLDKIKKTGKIKSRTAAGPTSDIFNGFCFYYFPNNLKGVARKFRIELYGRHGAFCINAWGPEFVTHVIVDSSSKYESLLQELKLDTLPVMALVFDAGSWC